MSEAVPDRAAGSFGVSVTDIRESDEREIGLTPHVMRLYGIGSKGYRAEVRCGGGHSDVAVVPSDPPYVTKTVLSDLNVEPSKSALVLTVKPYKNEEGENESSQ